MPELGYLLKLFVLERWMYFWKKQTLMFTFKFTSRTVKHLCPNLQKPPLPSKIPDYAPMYRSHFLKVVDCRPVFFLKKILMHA